jgi:glucose 1-dehydrogenase
MAEQVLAGQKALVTGGSSGIGAGVAIALAQAGADVVVNYHSGGDAARKIVEQIRTLGRQAIAVQADVGHADSVQALFRQSIEAFGTLDIVVSNAGLQKDAAFVDMSLEQWNQVIATNLTGMFLCSQQAAREFLRRGARPVSKALGKIICMSSVHEAIPWAGHVNYAASKGGIKAMMETIAQELAPHRIRVNSIGPGAIKTPINQDAWDSPEALKKLLKMIPYGRVGETDDIGKTAVWLASDASDYVTGQTLFVDGGMTLYPEFARGG